MDGMKRYAVYYAPPRGEFASRAAQWLGRDAESGQTLPPPSGCPAGDHAARVAEPCRYGFHATLKAPFRLVAGRSAGELHEALARLAEDLAPVRLEGLKLARIGSFLALVPESPSEALQQFAAAVVTGLEPFRASLTGAEMARRRPERLTERQRELLGLYGYPYVLEEFRFHMTLTGPLPEAEAGSVTEFLSGYLAPVAPRPFLLGEICLFGEPEGGPFRLLHRYPLTASSS